MPKKPKYYYFYEKKVDDLSCREIYWLEKAIFEVKFKRFEKEFNNKQKEVSENETKAQIKP